LSVLIEAVDLMATNCCGSGMNQSNCAWIFA
jgi:hypothetical protein